MEGFSTFKDSSHRQWIGSYCIPSCITHRPLPSVQISLKSKKLFVDRRTFETHFIRSTQKVDLKCCAIPSIYTRLNNPVHLVNGCIKLTSLWNENRGDLWPSTDQRTRWPAGMPWRQTSEFQPPGSPQWHDLVFCSEHRRYHQQQPRDTAIDTLTQLQTFTAMTSSYFHILFNNIYFSLS